MRWLIVVVVVVTAGCANVAGDYSGAESADVTCGDAAPRTLDAMDTISVSQFGRSVTITSLCADATGTVSGGVVQLNAATCSGFTDPITGASGTLSVIDGTLTLQGSDLVVSMRTDFTSDGEGASSTCRRTVTGTLSKVVKQ